MTEENSHSQRGACPWLLILKTAGFMLISIRNIEQCLR